MLPIILITVREVIEASLIVVTILGILTKLNQKESIKTVWTATIAAFIVSFLLVGWGSAIGIDIQKLYSGSTEPIIEAVLYIVSSFFITWGVFVLHKHFSHNASHLVHRMRYSINNYERNGIFILTFTAIFREGIEIVLFLSTLYLTNNTTTILIGFCLGVLLGVCVCIIFFSSTKRLPVSYAFSVMSMLLIIFAAGLLARGLGEIVEVIPLQGIPTLTLMFLPGPTTFVGGMIEAIFGIRRSMNAMPLIFYSLYLYGMHWWVFRRESNTHNT